MPTKAIRPQLRRVQRTGTRDSTRYVTIPAVLADVLGISAGDIVRMTAADGRLIVELVDITPRGGG